MGYNHEIAIGGLPLANPTILAPLAGITHLPFRLLAKKEGCAMVCSEMISANGLVQKSPKSHELLRSLPEEKPFSVQIFGSDPAILAHAAEIVQSSGANVLDINFGCAVKKVIKSGAGVALMRNLQKAEALLRAVRESIHIPLTIKIRSGWDNSGEQALTTAKIAEACGVDAITVHPRTAQQGFAGQADWSLIASIKKSTSIPVIGNGDIIQPQDVRAMLRETGCDAVMIGRAAIGNPWIFSQALTILNGEEISPISLEQRMEVMTRFLANLVAHFGEQRACFIMRSQLGWFVKSLPCSSKFRQSLKQISSLNQALTLSSSYMDSLQQNIRMLTHGSG